MNDTTMSTGRELHVAKECSEYTGLAGSFCTITSSNVDAIPVGSKVVYASAAGEKVIDSDLTIMTAGGRAPRRPCRPGHGHQSRGPSP